MRDYTLHVLVLDGNKWRTIIMDADQPLTTDGMESHILMEDVPDINSAKQARSLFDRFFTRFLEEGRLVHGGVVANTIQVAIVAFRACVQTAH